jgi:hypothetical protein
MTSLLIFLVGGKTTIYKPSDNHMTPEQFAQRFPPGQFLISNPDELNTSPDERPSYTKNVLRGTKVLLSCIIHRRRRRRRRRYYIVIQLHHHPSCCCCSCCCCCCCCSVAC